MQVILLMLCVLARTLAQQGLFNTHEPLSPSGQISLLRSDGPPPFPAPEPIDIVELPLPPVSPDTTPGSCSESINPHGTGCISQTTNLQSGSFTIDGDHVLSSVEFVGSPHGSIYTGLQIILIKANGGLFANGDAWKCVTCGIQYQRPEGSYTDLGYPQAFKDGKRLLAGQNIIDCGSHDLTSDECTPSQLHFYPIHWTVSRNTSAPSSPMRELRIHPDDTHIAWSSFTDGGQLCYLGRLKFNPSPDTATSNSAFPRYDLDHVNMLVSPDSPPPISTSGHNLTINPSSIAIGEVRGFSGTGNEITYIGYPFESSNIDVFAINLHTGRIRRLTAHPEYVDPVDISPDDNWHVVMDTRGSGRQMFLSAMRGMPPIIDLITTPITASTRNNGQRRFFQPYLIDRYGDRGTYFGQRINAAGDGSPGSINDPNWNGLADPKWSPDGTKIVYHQALVTAPACGGTNPLPCPNSTAQGGRTKRIMLAYLTTRKPLPKQEIATLPDTIPWATPYIPGVTPPLSQLTPIKAGTYILTTSNPSLSDSGSATITINTTSPSIDSTLPPTITAITVKYTRHTSPSFPSLSLSGSESVTVTRNGTTYFAHWFSNLTQVDNTTGTVNTKMTGREGMRIEIDVLENVFWAEGWLRSVVDGVEWRQPGNGM